MKQILLCFCFVTHSAFAGPVAVAESGDLRVVLTDEPCAMEVVKNLPKRATWTQNGKTDEGCWGASPIGVVMAYFADRTVVAFPRQIFVMVQGS